MAQTTLVHPEMLRAALKRNGVTLERVASATSTTSAASC
jgi:hypothetical protein